MGLLAAGTLGGRSSDPTAAMEASGPLRSDDAAQRLGVQLYTLRSLLEEDAEGTLARVAQIGYRSVETAGLYGRSAPDFRALLDRYELQCPAGHYPFEQHEDEPQRVVDAARQLGQRYVVWPWLPPHYRTSRDDYRRMAERFNDIGRRFADAGLRFAYHNHDFEFEQFEGRRPAYDLLVEHTDPDLVSFEFDVYWAYKAGYDPLAYMERYPGRFALVHLKDGGPPPERAMLDVGNGVIDFAALRRRAERAGTAFAFVEHDDPSDPIASIRAGYQHMHDL